MVLPILKYLEPSEWVFHMFDFKVSPLLVVNDYYLLFKIVLYIQLITILV